MNLHIFGHSISMPHRLEDKFSSFADTLLSRYNCPKENNHSVPAGSEERILYLLKKTKKIDFAIVFHSSPHFFFVPSIDRDMYIVGNEEYFWTNKLWPKMKYLAKRLQDQTLTSLDYTNAPRLDVVDFQRAYNDYCKYFYTRDTNANRHYGALIQIDQYLKAKNIKTIHCVLKDSLPEWYNLTSGVVDTEIATLQDTDSGYYVGPSASCNSISEEGNKFIADKLIAMIGADGEI